MKNARLNNRAFWETQMISSGIIISLACGELWGHAVGWLVFGGLVLIDGIVDA